MINTPDSIRDYSLERFQVLAKEKYDKGQAEHGGILTDRECLDELENEIIDFWFYLQGAKLKLARISNRPSAPFLRDIVLQDPHPSKFTYPIFPTVVC